VSNHGFSIYHTTDRTCFANAEAGKNAAEQGSRNKKFTTALKSCAILPSIQKRASKRSS
jgi:hypothetical protein